MAKKFYAEDNEAIPSIVFKETKPSGFTEITDQAELSRLYLKQNNKLKEDGKEYTANFKVVSFGVSYRDGTLSDISVDSDSVGVVESIRIYSCRIVNRFKHVAYCYLCLITS